MTGLTLGTLKRLPVREVFKDEARDFTPWLALPDNLAKIGNIICLDLELVGTEYAVGPFAADILCKASPGDGYVIIENQTTVSDHTHLGQIMTYSAGLNALATVWIASSFKAEHREAVDREDDRGLVIEAQLPHRAVLRRLPGHGPLRGDGSILVRRGDEAKGG